MYSRGEIPEFRRRFRYLVAVVLLSFVVLAARLCQLQVLDVAIYQQWAENNFVQERKLPSTRGRIRDRRGRILADNRRSFDVYFRPKMLKAESLERTISLLSLDPEETEAIRGRAARASKRKGLRLRLLIRDISRARLAVLETHSHELTGIEIVAAAQRHYPNGNLGAHFLGYVNEINSRELKAKKGEAYQVGDLVGRFGIERMYETQLRGVTGRQRQVVDAHGRKKLGSDMASIQRGMARIDPVPGQTLVLTIDLELQRVVERALRRHESGALVVVEVNSGRILAAASRPAFDPNAMSGRLTTKEANRLMTDPHRPMIDKVFREHYYPGSIYKPVSAIAAIEEHALKWSDTIKCKGWHSFGRRVFRCSHAHGTVDLQQAIVESCNVYFYDLAEKVGMDAIAKHALRYGFGAPSGLGLNGEVSGFLPTKEWYVRRRIPFRIGFTLNTAIGQGSTKVTPIQAAMFYAALGNGGTLYVPQIVERTEDESGHVIGNMRVRVRRRLGINPDTLNRVREALHGVVQSEKGTAHASHLPDLEVSGKTGTAQVVRRQSNKTYWQKDHAWFAGYAPSDNPEIALAVIIEHGGKAAQVAVPIAMEVFSSYYKFVKNRQKDNK